MSSTMIQAAAERAGVADDADVVERILSFDFAGGDLSDFEPRLRRENGWSAAFARRAIAEYRKFLILAATARHPVSPSDVVDQVWHLHLLYTRSYWDDLCGSILPRPLHHAPTTGEAGEAEKFADWYAKTLASYRRCFGDDPPRDIWPAPTPAPGSKSPRHRYVNLETHIVIPRLDKVARLGVVILLLALLLLLVGGCGGAGAGGAGNMRASDLAGGAYNPLDLPGPQFLIVYAAAFAVACAIAYRIRAKARAMADGEDNHASRAPAHATAPIDLDPYEIAYLNGGPVLAINAAIARLVERGDLQANDDGTLRRYSADALATIDGHPLEQAVFEAVGARRTPIRDVRSRVETRLATLRRQLDDSGYLLDPDRAATARRVATLVALSVPAVGVIKFMIGLERGKPVGLLVIFTVVFAGLALLLFARGLHRSARGERVLEHLKAKHASVRTHPIGAGAGSVTDAMRGPAVDGVLPLGVALFGLTWLSGSEHAGLRKALTPKHGSADGWSSSFSSCGGTSSCGGSSCGGGTSSCGGSSCGGGGCGGCGGGD